jgi:hypothetical protein
MTQHALPWDRFPAEHTPAESLPVPAPAPPPEPPAEPPPTAQDVVVADARNRSWRTLIQGLLFDVFAAVVASVAMLTGADPFVKETWITFGLLLLKSVASAAISYVMRLRIPPHTLTPDPAQ